MAVEAILHGGPGEMAGKLTSHSIEDRDVGRDIEYQLMVAPAFLRGGPMSQRAPVLPEPFGASATVVTARFKFDRYEERDGDRPHYKFVGLV